MGQEFGKGLPGWLWLKVSHAVAVRRRLELWQQQGEAHGGWLSILLPYVVSEPLPVVPLPVVPLPARAPLGFEMSWQPQGSWTAYMAAEGFKSE